jgi:hypothetical protein
MVRSVLASRWLRAGPHRPGEQHRHGARGITGAVCAAAAPGSPRRDPAPGRPAVRACLLASVAAAGLVAVVSACSSAAPLPHRAAGHSRSPAAAAAAVTAGSPAAAPASPASTPPAPPTVLRCVEKNLTTAVASYQNGGGQAGIVLQLTNAGTAPCSLYGYPGLGLEDGSHRIMPSKTHWGSTYFAEDPGPRLIILVPGQSATSSVAFAGGWPRKGWAYDLEVTPPDAYDHAVIPLSYGTGGAGGDIYATAMARHTTIVRGSPGGCGCNP